MLCNIKSSFILLALYIGLFHPISHAVASNQVVELDNLNHQLNKAFEQKKEFEELDRNGRELRIQKELDQLKGKISVNGVAVEQFSELRDIFSFRAQNDAFRVVSSYLNSEGEQKKVGLELKIYEEKENSGEIEISIAMYDEAFTYIFDYTSFSANISELHSEEEFKNFIISVMQSINSLSHTEVSSVFGNISNLFFPKAHASGDYFVGGLVGIVIGVLGIFVIGNGSGKNYNAVAGSVEVLGFLIIVFGLTVFLTSAFFIGFDFVFNRDSALPQD